MSEIQKRKKGQILNNNERQLIMNLMHYLREKNSEKSISEIIREISKATGCSERTIYKIRKEASKGITVVPNKTRLRKKENKNSRNVKYDSYIKSSIRNKVHSYLLQNVAPTLNTILCLVNNDPDLPNFKRSTLHTLLKEIGFVYQQKGKKSLLTERCDLVKCRQEYLKDMKRFRSENRWIVYTGETLISLMRKEVKKTEDQSNHVMQVNPVIVNNTINCETVNAILLTNSEIMTGGTFVYTIDACSLNNTIASNCRLTSEDQDASTNKFNILPNSSYLLGGTSSTGDDEPQTVEDDCQMSQSKIARELRFTIMAAGCESGFLEGAEHISLSKKRNDDTDNYERWFINKLLPKIPPNSVIVIDNNAPYHKKKEENIPDVSWKKHQIKNWLTSKNVNVKELSQKKDLLAMVNDLRSMYSTRQKIDELAKQRGIILVSLPPYHYELNPINMIWAQVKCHVRSNMRSFKIRKIKQLVKEGFYAITEVNWMNYVHNVRQMEDLLWAVDELQESNQSNSIDK